MRNAAEQLIRRWYQEGWNEHNTGSIRELLAPDCRIKGNDGHTDAERGVDAFLKLHADLLAALPDPRTTVERVTQEGGLLRADWTATATHHGEFCGLPLTGQPIR